MILFAPRRNIRYVRLYLICFFFCLVTCAAEEATPVASSEPPIMQTAPRGAEVSSRKHRKKLNASVSQTSIQPGGVSDTLQKLQEKQGKASAYSRWKMQLPFWWRKAVVFIELALVICLGVILGQMIEVAGLVRYIAIVAWPLLRLGGLPRAAGAPFVMAFQSGAVANTMLVAAWDEGLLSKRQLYTSVLVVSCLSLFAHLPTFIIPLAAAFGVTAAAVFFSVRFSAILTQIIVMLLVSNLLIRRFTCDVFPVPIKQMDESLPAGVAAQNTRVIAATCANIDNKGGSSGFCMKVWRRSRRTLTRLLLFVIPTFFIMSALEWWHVFDNLEVWLAGFSWSWLPPQAAAIIAAQLVSLYNGAIVAGSFVDSGAIQTQQAIVILLFGSVLTAPARTLKHALPTYVAVLGLRPGTLLAISAQVLRILFLGAATLLLVYFWMR